MCVCGVLRDVCVGGVLRDVCVGGVLRDMLMANAMSCVASYKKLYSTLTSLPLDCTLVSYNYCAL